MSQWPQPNAPRGRTPSISAVLPAYMEPARRLAPAAAERLGLEAASKR